MPIIIFFLFECNYLIWIFFLLISDVYFNWPTYLKKKKNLFLKIYASLTLINHQTTSQHGPKRIVCPFSISWQASRVLSIFTWIFKTFIFLGLFPLSTPGRHVLINTSVWHFQFFFSFGRSKKKKLKPPSGFKKIHQCWGCSFRLLCVHSLVILISFIEKWIIISFVFLVDHTWWWWWNWENKKIGKELISPSQFSHAHFLSLPLKNVNIITFKEVV